MQSDNFSKHFFNIIVWIIVLIGFFIYKNLNAQDNSPVDISTSVDKPIATVGDLIRFKIELRTEKEIHPQEPTPLESKKGLIYVKRERPEISFENDKNIAIFYYIFRADLVGRFAIPKIKIKFLAPHSKTPGKSIEGTINSPETFVEVRSVLKTKKGPPTLQDIKPLIEIKPSILYYWPYAMMVFLLALLIYYFIKKQKRSFVDSPAERVKQTPCHILALQELEELKKKNLLARGLISEYYFQLSEIFRKYIGSRYSFPALDRTQQEIFSYLDKIVAISDLLKSEIASILEKTDRVKFAKVNPTIDESNEIMKSIIRFVKSTIPVAQKHQEITSNQV